MIRTQIQLTEEQAASLRRLARRRGVSVAAVIREATEEYISRTEDDPERIRERALAAIGAFASGHSDIAVDHDRYLAEIYEE